MYAEDWSAPETEVFERLCSRLEDGHDAAVATVVDVEGSAYRRPGAKMVVDGDGGAGSLTAGCLEDEVRTAATAAIEDGVARVETWDLTTEEWGMGLGCDGVTRVLVEPLTASYQPVADAWQAGEPIGVATVLGGALPLGTRGRYDPDAGFDEGLPQWIRERATDAMERCLRAGDTETISVGRSGEDVDLLLEGIRPPPELVVFGAGHDVAPVVELARVVDFRVTVVSFRGGRADPERFPGADRTIAASPRDIGTLRAWDEDTYAVVMSHNFLDDRLALAELLETPVGYIGLMGPRSRFERVCEAFVDAGRPLTDADRERIYAPVGLDLGADTPYQVAHSVVAELLAVANDRTPGHLRRNDGPIHERLDTR